MNGGILSTIGNTPLVSLDKIFPGSHFRLFAKLEAFNPGGSIKDRPAFNIIRQGMHTGKITPKTTIVESSSGNMGIGIAQICSYLGLRFICVADAKTMSEIAVALAGRVDYLFCAASTCGTLRGCVEYVRREGLPTKVCAVDAVGSVIFGSRKAKRLIPGHGAALVPPLFDGGLADRVVHVTDRDCVVGCRRLVKTEGILAGGSSGAVLMALRQVAGQIPDGANCVVIFPDRGERYLDTIYSDEWVAEHFGSVEHLWDAEARVYESMVA